MIEVIDLHKSYGDKVILDGISFKAEPGYITGFVGANGAGKSTTMKIICGLEEGNAGQTLVDGAPFRQSANPKRCMGTFMGSDFLPHKTKAKDYLGFVAKVAREPKADINDILGQVGLSGKGDMKIGAFSLGMKQRLGIAGALLGNPENLMFDEPINGLDVNGIIWIRELMREQANQGKTVLLSSHIMSELDVVADNVVMLKDGRISCSGSVKSLEQSAQMEVLVDGPDRAAIRAALEAAGLTVLEGDMHLRVQGAEPTEVGRLVYASGASLSHLERFRGSLENLFLSSKGGN
ncbi:MAG: ATP-binding cassette domain-containing protein [Coriobacteriia bacterium]|nr:ATP-binding cassette domain-containing protein [Coriobacteriia bacterium]